MGWQRARSVAAQLLGALQLRHEVFAVQRWNRRDRPRPREPRSTDRSAAVAFSGATTIRQEDIGAHQRVLQEHPGPNSVISWLTCPTTNRSTASGLCALETLSQNACTVNQEKRRSTA